MQEIINIVKEFHEAFNIGNEEEPIAKITEKDYTLRYQLMKEEISYIQPGRRVFPDMFWKQEPQEGLFFA